MHQLIRIISTAEDQDTAAEQAYAFADQLVEDGTFDHYVVQSGRYEESGITYSLAEAAGQLLVDDALKQNRDAFMTAIRAARLMLARFTDEQIYQNTYDDEKRDSFASRRQFSIIGGATHDCYIYGDESLWGEKINNDKDYGLAVQDIEPGELWVTALEMHH
jgi:hypothetical protein